MKPLANDWGIDCHLVDSLLLRVTVYETNVQ